MGFAEALSAPESVWSLVDAGFQVCAFSRRGRCPALRQSRYLSVHEITAPEKDVAAARTELAELLAKVFADRSGPHVFLPLDDAALWLGAHTPLPAGWISAGPNETLAELALNKWKQIELARAAGFTVPESAVISHLDELARFSKSLPVILRPAQAVREEGPGLGKGSNWICADESELQKAAKQWRGHGSLLVQPFLRGVGEGVFGFATRNGVVGWSAHRRLRMMNPHGSGSSACVSRRVPKEARAAAERFVRQADWRGMFMIEMLAEGDGRNAFVEFNGRAWGSMALARRLGFEYPAWSAQLALDPDFSPTMPAAPAKEIECRNLGRELMHLLFVLRGPRSRALQEWPSAWKTVGNFFRGLGTSAFYNSRRGDRRVFLRDTCNTIRDQFIKRKS